MLLIYNWRRLVFRMVNYPIIITKVFVVNRDTSYIDII
jgi:hypothetical protein